MTSLKEAKEILSDNILGKESVHGIGISRNKNLLRIYMSDELKKDLVVEPIRDLVGDDCDFVIVIDPKPVTMHQLS